MWRLPSKKRESFSGFPFHGIFRGLFFDKDLFDAAHKHFVVVLFRIAGCVDGRIDKSGRVDRLLMQLAAIALSILDVVLHFTGYLHHIVLAWIAFGLSVLLWSGTMIIGDRKAKNELKRKLHI